MIAELAGISSTAVSLALRNHPKISEATRRRVRQIAARIGYRPDPEVAKLMHHLRSRHKKTFQATLCAFTTEPNAERLPYSSKIVQSARERADALGYRLELVLLPPDVQRRPDLQRMLRTRGIEGVLLLPMKEPRDFRDLLDWSQFSVIASTYAVLAPQFHRVVPHQFGNMLMLCERLAALGHRRIGLVQDEAHDLRTHHSFSAAVAWQNVLGGSEFVQPFVYRDDDPRSLVEWFESQRPDAIIYAGAANSVAATLGLSIPGPVSFAVTSIQDPRDCALAGVYERPEAIGARAVELLASMVQQGDKGIPEVPSVTMIEGRWLDGPSAPSRAPASSRPGRAGSSRRTARGRGRR